jgi:hypothetical protein
MKICIIVIGGQSGPKMTKLTSHTGVNLAVQAETKLPTWTGLDWLAATLCATSLEMSEKDW